MYNVTEIVRQFKSKWTSQLEEDAILAACQRHDYTWRERVLGPVLTVRLFLLQILCGNTACAHVPHLAHVDLTASAYCQARARLPLAVFRTLLDRTLDKLNRELHDAARWLGHRVFLIDGTSFSMPDTPELQKHFGQHGQQMAGCGFPIAHVLARMHAGTGMVLEMLASPLRTHDMSRVVDLHPALEAGDAVVGDRGLCSYVHLVLLSLRGAFGVFRMHQRQIVDFRPHRRHARARRRKGVPTSRWIKRLGRWDQLVEWVKPKTRPMWMSAEQYATIPERLLVRELRYHIGRRGYRVRRVTLATTLIDSVRYPAEELSRLYGGRWQIETNFAHLKTTLGMDVLRCQTVDGVLKELIVFALVYNLVRLVMCDAAQRQRVSVHRLSFIDALRWLIHATPHSPPPRLAINPDRPGRLEPRARKRRPKEYDLLSTPRSILRKRLLRQRVKN